MANRAAQFRAANPDLTVTRRGRRSIEFQQPDGSRRLITTIEPLHYGAGNAEIDTAWQAAAAPWAWQMLSSDYQVRALSRLNNGQVIQWADPTSGQTLTLQPMALNWVNTANDALQQISMPQAVEAVAEDDRLRWANGYGSGRHFRYTAHPTSLIKELVIDAASNLPAPTVANPALELSFILGYSSGVTLWVDGAQWDRSTKITTANEIEFRLSGGAVAWRMVRPGAVDSAGSTCAGLFRLRRSGSSRYVTVRIPKTWLDAAVYPVTIDPTLTTPQTAAAVADTMILAGYATTNFGTWEYGLQTGRDGSNSCRMLFEFDISEIAAGASISSATLSMKCVYLDSGAGSRAHSIYELRSGRAGWSETQATWNIYSTGNNWSTAGADNTTSDRQSSTLATFNSPASVNNWVNVSLSTSAVAGWCGSSNSNYGFLVVMTPEANYTKTSWQSSDGSTSADRPYLTVVYSTNTTISVTDAVTAGETVTVTALPANIAASVTDASTIAETITARLAALAISRSEGVTAADSATVSPIAITRSITDAITTGEAATVSPLALARSVTDAITAGEAVTAGPLSLARSIADAATLADSVTAGISAALLISVTDGAAAGENSTAALAALRVTVTDGATSGETTTAAVGAIAALAASVADGLNVAETVTVRAAAALMVSVSEGAAAAETITARHSAALAISAVDALTLAEAVSGEIGALAPRTVSVQDAVTVGDGVTLAALAILAAVTEGLTAAESAVITPLILGGVSVQDGAGVGGVVTVAAGQLSAITVNVQDGAAVGELAGVSFLPLEANVSESVTIGEVVTVGPLGLVAVVQEAAQAVDSVWIATTVIAVIVLTARGRSSTVTARGRESEVTAQERAGNVTTQERSAVVTVKERATTFD